MTMLQQFIDPSSLLPPLLYGLAAFVGLELLYRLLRRLRVVRRHDIAYNVIILLTALVVFAESAQLIDQLQGAVFVRSSLELALFSLYAFLAIQAIVEVWLGAYMQRRGVMVPRLLRDLALVVLLSAAVLLIYGALFGISNLSTLVVSSTVISAIIGLALQDLLKNLIAGIALQFERPFNVGDWVQIDGQVGQVRETSWRATWLCTVDETLLIMPNASVAEKTVANFSALSKLEALHVTVSLHYATPPGLAKQVLARAAREAESVLPDPPPAVRLVQFAESAVVYDVKFWLADYSRYVETRDAVMTSIWYHLRRAGLAMPYPIRDVTLRNIGPEDEVRAEQLRLDRMAASLRAVELLAILDDAELHELAARTRVAIFGAGETLTRQDEPGASFFIVQTGRARVEVRSESGQPLTVGMLGPGEFFGELSLLTGAPRSATVVALDDCHVLEIDHAAIAPLLEQNRNLPERLGEVLEQRLAANALLVAQHALEESRSNGAGAISRNGLVARIRSLFDLAAPPEHSQ